MKGSKSEVQKGLWKNPDDLSIELMKMYEPQEGYYLAFSGGKDSIVLYDIALRAEVKFDAHYNLTTCDPPELVKFIKQRYPIVQINRPKESMWRLIPKKGLPTRISRWCCDVLKERSGMGRIVLTGIRDAESYRRKSRHTVEPCFKDSSKVFVHAIKQWSETDIWSYIKNRNIEYCSLYDEGFRRLGCVICPFERNVQRSMARWPRIWEAARRATVRLYERRAKSGGTITERFRDGNDLFEWWCNRDAKKRDELPLFG